MSATISPLAPGEELIDAESFRRLHAGTGEEAGWRPPPLTSAPHVARAPRAVSQTPIASLPIAKELARCATRRDAEEAALRRARAHVPAAAIFQSRRGGIEIALCDPEPRRRPGPIYWTGRPHTLVRVLEQGRVLRGAPARDPLTSRLLRMLDREGVQEIALLPISVRQRVFGFLYADAGTEPLPDASFAALAEICEHLALATERTLGAS